MTYNIPPHRHGQIRRILDLLDHAQSVVLTTHLNADGDGCGSQAALLELLLSRGKEGWVVNPTPFPDLYRFLFPDPSRILHAGSEEALRRSQAADLVVVVDTAEVPRIGRVNPLIRGRKKVVIDHHPPGERLIDGTHLVDTSAAAAGELVFDILVEAGGPWTPAAVDGLYTAILTDTGSFRFSNATANILRVAAELVERGASPDDLYRRVYGSHPMRRFRLLRRALDTLDTAYRGQVAWMVIPREAYARLGCEPDDLEGLVDIPREVRGAEVAILFREMEDGEVKISFRSNGEVDVNQLAVRFDGGGHIRASGAVVSGELDEVIRDVVTAAGEELETEASGATAAREAPAATGGGRRSYGEPES